MRNTRIPFEITVQKRFPQTRPERFRPSCTDSLHRSISIFHPNYYLCTQISSPNSHLQRLRPPAKPSVTKTRNVKSDRCLRPHRPCVRPYGRPSRNPFEDSFRKVYIKCMASGPASDPGFTESPRGQSGQPGEMPHLESFDEKLTNEPNGVSRYTE